MLRHTTASKAAPASRQAEAVVDFRAMASVGEQDVREEKHSQNA